MHSLLDTWSSIDTAPVEAALVVEGAPTTGSRSLTTVGDVEVGVWEMTPGVARDVEADEAFIVLSGSASIEFDDGGVITVGPGSAVRLGAGDRTTWTVHQTLRKIYVI